MDNGDSEDCVKMFGKDGEDFMSRFDKISRKHRKDRDSFYSKFLDKDKICGSKKRHSDNQAFTLT
jgi:hypothetical protein